MKARDIATLMEQPASSGPVVLLAVGPEAQKSGWAARTALELAEAFAARGERVVLVDLSLQTPELHAALGVDNDEGLSDVFLFGASLPHITHAVRDGSFQLIPASAFTPEPAEVLAHKRWGHVFEELSANQNKLLAYLPIDVDGAHSFSDRVGTTIVLANNSEVEKTEQALSSDADVIGVLTPKPVKPVKAAAEPKLAGEESVSSQQDRDEAFEKIRIPKDAAREALIADLRQRQRAALMAPPPAMAPLPEEGMASQPLMRAMSTSTPTPLRPRSDVRPLHLENVQPLPRPKTHWGYWLVALLFLGAASASSWYYFQQRRTDDVPPLVAHTSGNNPKPNGAAAVVAKGDPLPWSVAIASYQVMSLALERLDQLRAVENAIEFYIGPTLMQGTMYYRVMAGPVRDSTAAVELRDTLIARRIKTGSSGWDVVSTPYAFLLGDFDRRGDAEATLYAAENKGIPSYMITAASPDGSTHYKLYAGAYTGPGDAEFLRPILKAAGFPDNLVERTGSIR